MDNHRLGNRCGGMEFAIFTFENDKINDLWVWGDVHGLMGRLKEAECENEFIADRSARV